MTDNKPSALQNGPLRLAAHDPDDLKVFSTFLQDAVGKVGDMAYVPEARQFAIVLNRFRWETTEGKARGPYERVRAGLHFNDVLAVRQQKIRLDAKDAVLSLLSVDVDMLDETRATATLNFSGGGAVQLDLECIDARLEDIIGPWRAARKPKHDV